MVTIVFAVVAMLHPRARAHAIDADQRAEGRSLFAIGASATTELLLLLVYVVMIALTPLAVATMALIRLATPRRKRASKKPVGA